MRAFVGGASSNKKDVTALGPKRHKFRATQDIALLQQVLADRPFLAPHGQQDDAWQAVATNLRDAAEGFKATGRAMRDRYNHLVRIFQSDNRESLRRSGSAEEYEIRDQLLTEAIEMQQSFKALKEEKKRKREADQEIGELIRQQAMQSLKPKRDTRPELELSDERDDGGLPSTSVVRKTGAATTTRTSLQKRERQTECALRDEEVSSPVDTALRTSSAAATTTKRLLFSIMQEKENRKREEKEAEKMKFQAELERLANERENTAVKKDKIRIEEEKLRLQERKMELDAEQQKAQTALLMEMFKKISQMH